MGRTNSKFTDYDDDRNHRTHKGAKHSRNIPGQGMRIINNWSDEDDDFFEDEIDMEDEVSIELIKPR